MKVTVEILEKYADEIKRKHLTELGIRTFKHPNHSSVIIVVKGYEILGMTRNSILRDNAKTRDIIRNNDYIEFTYWHI